MFSTSASWISVNCKLTGTTWCLNNNLLAKASISLILLTLEVTKAMTRVMFTFEFGTCPSALRNILYQNWNLFERFLSFFCSIWIKVIFEYVNNGPLWVLWFSFDYFSFISLLCRYYYHFVVQFSAHERIFLAIFNSSFSLHFRLFLSIFQSIPVFYRFYPPIFLTILQQFTNFLVQFQAFPSIFQPITSLMFFSCVLVTFFWSQYCTFKAQFPFLGNFRHILGLILFFIGII